MAGKKRGAGKEQSLTLRWVLLVAVIIVLGLLLYTSLPKSTGNVVVSDSNLALGWSFSQGVKSDLTNVDVRAITGGNTKIVNEGNDGKAIAFDGRGDYLKVSKVYSPLSGSFPLSAVTVVGRFKTSSFTLPVVMGSGGSGDIVKQGSQITGSWVAQREAFVLDPETDGSVKFYAFINGHWYAATSLKNSIALNVWEHWAGTYDGSALRLYKNGVLIPTATQAVSGKAGTGVGGVTATISDLYIGTDGDIPDSPERSFNGKIDDLRIYTRALSASEIKDLYESATGSGSGTPGTTGTTTTTSGTGSGTTTGTTGTTGTTTTTSGTGSGTTTGTTGTTTGTGSGTTTIAGTTPSCKDSDQDAAHPDGINPGVAGVLTCGTTTYADSCFSVKAVKEYYYDAGIDGYEVTYLTCATTEQCSNNACVAIGGSISTQNNLGTPSGISGGDGGGSVIRILSAQEFSAGKQIRATVGDITRFKVGDTYDSADLRTVSENQATFLVTSIPQIVTLSKGGSKKVDVNGDGVFDVLLTLENVNRPLQQVDFTLKSIKDAVAPSGPGTGGSTPPGASDSGASLGGGASSTGGSSGVSPTVIIIGVLLGLAILAALAKLFLSKRKAEEE